MKPIKFLAAIAFLFFPVFVRAETPTATPESSLTEKIKERLQETAEEGLVTIKEQLTTKATEPSKKAYIGKITTLDKNQLTLTYKEQNFTVDLHPKAELVKGSSTPLEFSDLKIGDFIIAFGFYSPADDKFTAVRLSVIKQPEPPVVRQLIQGKITEVDGQKLKINNKTITLTAKTKLQISGVDEPETEDISLSDYLFAIVVLNANGDIDKVSAAFVQPGRQNPAGLAPTNSPAATKSGDAQQ